MFYSENVLTDLKPRAFELYSAGKREQSSFVSGETI